LRFSNLHSKAEVRLNLEPPATEEDYSIEGLVSVAPLDEQVIAESQFNIIGELWANEAESLKSRDAIRVLAT
jgi:hypothetical protein